MKIYDLIIIGAGPAGLTAGIYASRKKMDFLIISLDVGGQAAWSGNVENYTGYQFISGPELAQKFQEHARQYGVELIEGQEVKEVIKTGRLIQVNAGGRDYQSRSLIIASGKKSKELGLPGEKEFKNHGLTYCATCDGPIFFGKDVAVIGGGNSAMDAVLQLTRIARQIYLVNNTPDLSGDPIMLQKIRQNNKVMILNNSSVTGISGDRFVKGIKVKDGLEERDLAVEGVFVEIGLEPNSSFVQGVEKNSENEIIVNSRNQTSLEGVFAAGDVTDVPEKQIIIAAGEGAKATLSAFSYLSKNNF
jgi:thioredoxin-disulfide reductase